MSHTLEYYHSEREEWIEWHISSYRLDEGFLQFIIENNGEKMVRGISTSKIKEFVVNFNED